MHIHLDVSPNSNISIMILNLQIWILLWSSVNAITKDLLSDRRYCGYQHSDDYVRASKNISIDEFPWMVQLIYDKGSISCSGSIINNRYILTAAHCLAAPRTHLHKVRLGDYNVKTIADCVPFLDDQSDCSEPFKDFEIEQSITHPAYNAKTGVNDVGLIRLSKTILYSDFIRPICLPRDENLQLQNRTRLITSGWGLLGYDQQPTELKKKVLAELLTFEECEKVYGNRVLTRDHLCVNEYESITCHGDTGAPLMRSVRNQWEQVGIMVTGTRICTPNYTLFNKVTDYLFWIKNVLRP